MIINYVLKNKVSGFTMIEVLVSMVVLAIGLLGIAGLQVVGMKNNHSSYLRSQATILAYDISDILRSNINLVNTTSTFDSYTSSTPGSTVGACTDGTDTTCSPTQMATTDLALWAQSLVSQLPAGQGVISRSGDIFTVRVTWEDESQDYDSDGVTTKSFSTSFRP